MPLALPAFKRGLPLAHLSLPLAGGGGGDSLGGSFVHLAWGRGSLPCPAGAVDPGSPCLGGYLTPSLPGGVTSHPPCLGVVALNALSLACPQVGLEGLVGEPHVDLALLVWRGGVGYPWLSLSLVGFCPLLFSAHRVSLPSFLASTACSLSPVSDFGF